MTLREATSARMLVRRGDSSKKQRKPSAGIPKNTKMGLSRKGNNYFKLKTAQKRTSGELRKSRRVLERKKTRDIKKARTTNDFISWLNRYG